jgi:DNA polymerase-3 subunit gamma/tau
MAPRYEVTASKYRPKTFDELAGQEFVVSTIKNSLKSGQIAHAYLFSGPRGCGKTSAARILARSLNCEKGVEAGPCIGANVCDNCLAITQGSSMDVLEIDGASNNSVNDIRQIKDEVLFPPHSGRYKVYIIDEVHMLSAGAFAALLKTIEEPPPYICFIFATTELHKVPATIKSRCQQFNFRLISVETIQELLKKICKENNLKAEDDALFWIARESTGSMRDALTLFDQVVSFSDGNIRSELIREKLGIVGLDKLNALADSCAENNSQKSFALIDEILDNGVAIEQFVIDLTGYYRSLLLLKNEVTKESLLGYRPGLFSSKALETYDSIRLEHALDVLLDCYRNIRYSVSPRFELEAAVSKLIWLNKWVSPVELKEILDKTRGIFGNSFAPIKPVVPMTTNTPPEKQPNEKQPTEKQQMAGGRSLTEEFQRMVAAKEGSASVDDEDVPMWDSSIKKTETENPIQVEQILSVIPGTIV